MIEIEWSRVQNRFLQKFCKNFDESPVRPTNFFRINILFFIAKNYLFHFIINFTFANILKKTIKFFGGSKYGQKGST
jgi:hypothetical protein